MTESKKNYDEQNSAVSNLTALWAFTEGFLGGILNAVKIPFKGLILGNISVFIIILISRFTEKKGAVFKAGIITAAAKAIISPYSSLPSYFAVFAQTVLGELFFLKRKFMTASAILLAVTTSVLSSVQRVIILTLIFGNAFWETIDGYGKYLHNEFFGSNNIYSGFELSNWLIGIYVFIHALAGFFSGLYFSGLSLKIKSDSSVSMKMLEEYRNQYTVSAGIAHEDIVKKKNQFLKLPSLILYLFIIATLLFTYTTDISGYFNTGSIWFMLIRSVIIMILWIKVFNGFFREIIRKKLLKNESRYSAEIENTMRLIPSVKDIFRFSWKYSEGKGIKKLNGFLLHFTSLIIGLSPEGVQ